LLLSALQDIETKVCFVLGPAGTGKTFIACQYALEKLVDDNSKQVLITKPLVSVADEELGFFPGGINSKLQPWMQNILHCMQKNNTNIVNQFLNSKKIEFVPMGFMRGSTLDNTILIADEMQNSTPLQLKMLLTRIGTNTKIIITGDVTQKDVSFISGLEDILEKLQNMPQSSMSRSIQIIEFNIDDIQRDEFVKYVLQIYEQNVIKPIPNDIDTLTLYKKLITGSLTVQYDDKYVDNYHDDNKGKKYDYDGGFNDSAMIPKR